MNPNERPVVGDVVVGDRPPPGPSMAAQVVSPLAGWLGSRTLVRRVMFTLAGAVMLIWLSVSVYEWSRIQNADKQLQIGDSSAAAIMAGMLDLTDEQGAHVVHAMEAYINADRRRIAQEAGSFGLKLSGFDEYLTALRVTSKVTGEVVYASEHLKAEAVETLPPGPFSTQLMMGGHAYWAMSFDNARWHVEVFDRRMELWTMLYWDLIAEMVSLLWLIGLLMFVLWWVVWQGLRPLRQFAVMVHARRGDDLSALKLDMRYAELKPIVEAMNALLAKAREGLQRERQFVQEAAHEMRTPMSVMATQAHALMSAPDEAARKQAHDALLRAVERSSHLVHQLLTLSRLEGAKVLKARHFDAVEWVRQQIIDFTTAADAKGIELQCVSPPVLPVSCSVVALHSVLDNLLSNALKYCPRGSLVVVELTERSDGSLSLTVKDDGPGVSQVMSERMFERFHRGVDEGAMTASGVGLGLAIVSEAAQRLSGQLSVGKGLQGQGLGVTLVWPPCVREVKPPL